MVLTVENKQTNKQPRKSKWLTLLCSTLQNWWVHCNPEVDSVPMSELSSYSQCYCLRTSEFYVHLENRINETFANQTNPSCSKQTDEKRTVCTPAIVAELVLHELLLDACFQPHLANLGHAQVGVPAKEEFPCVNGQVVLWPVPQKLEVLVIKRWEGVHAAEKYYSMSAVG